MKEWEKALNLFLEKWKKQDYVIGAIVCGSFVTTNPSTNSDIDVHIILSDEVNWRERGNIVINNYLIEYFANPPKQIKKYFEEDYKNSRKHSMVQFLTGKIIFDKHDEIEKLKNEAKIWFYKKYNELNDTSIELIKYRLWDNLDNLEDCYKQDRKDFEFVYYNSVRILFEEYSKYLRIGITPFSQIFRYMSKPNFREKYLLDEFPDKYFSDKLLNSLKDNEKAKRMELFIELTDYVLNKMGGFNIDGWKIRI